MATKWTSKSFYGKEITDQEKKEGRINYRTLASVFNHILVNNIVDNWDNWELVNGREYEEDEDGKTDYDRPVEVFQYYIIDNMGVEVLEDLTNELVWYDNKLDCYIWGVCHWGTAWDGVNTEIEIELN